MARSSHHNSGGRRGHASSPSPAGGRSDLPLRNQDGTPSRNAFAGRRNNTPQQMNLEGRSSYESAAHPFQPVVVQGQNRHSQVATFDSDLDQDQDQTSTVVVSKHSESTGKQGSSPSSSKLARVDEVAAEATPAPPKTPSTTALPEQPLQHSQSTRTSDTISDVVASRLSTITDPYVTPQRRAVGGSSRITFEDPNESYNLHNRGHRRQYASTEERLPTARVSTSSKSPGKSNLKQTLKALSPIKMKSPFKRSDKKLVRHDDHYHSRNLRRVPTDPADLMDDDPEHPIPLYLAPLTYRPDSERPSERSGLIGRAIGSLSSLTKSSTKQKLGQHSVDSLRTRTISEREKSLREAYATPPQYRSQESSIGRPSFDKRSTRSRGVHPALRGDAPSTRAESASRTTTRSQTSFSSNATHSQGLFNFSTARGPIDTSNIVAARPMPPSPRKQANMELHRASARQLGAQANEITSGGSQEVSGLKKQGSRGRFPVNVSSSTHERPERVPPTPVTGFRVNVNKALPTPPTKKQQNMARQPSSRVSESSNVSVLGRDISSHNVRNGRQPSHRFVPAGGERLRLSDDMFGTSSSVSDLSSPPMGFLLSDGSQMVPSPLHIRSSNADSNAAATPGLEWNFGGLNGNQSPAVHTEALLRGMDSRLTQMEEHLKALTNLCKETRRSFYRVGRHVQAVEQFLVERERRNTTGSQTGADEAVFGDGNA